MEKYTETYTFNSLDGVGPNTVFYIFRAMRDKMFERVRPSTIKYEYTWLVGGNVYRRMKDLNMGFSNHDKFIGIDFKILAPGDRSNTIILECKEPSNARKLIGDITHGYSYVDTDTAAAINEAKKEINAVYGVNAFKDGCVTINNKREERVMYNKMYNKMFKKDLIKDVIFNDPATIVLWRDGVKTVVKATGEKFDPEKGLAMAIAKRYFGNQGNYYNEIKKWLPKEESELTSVWPSEPITLSDVAGKISRKLDEILSNRKKYYTVKELAAIDGVGENAIRRRIKKGFYANAIKQDGVWLVPYSSIHKNGGKDEK